jgi:hypothetical protein
MKRKYLFLRCSFAFWNTFVLHIITILYSFTYASKNIFDVRKSVHHHTIQIIQPTRCNSFTSLLLDVYVWLNMFRASPSPSSGACNCTRSLCFYRWREAAGALWVVFWQVDRLDHDQKHSSHFSPTVKPETPNAVVRS